MNSKNNILFNRVNDTKSLKMAFKAIFKFICEEKVGVIEFKSEAFDMVFHINTINKNEIIVNVFHKKVVLNTLYTLIANIYEVLYVELIYVSIDRMTEKDIEGTNKKFIETIFTIDLDKSKIPVSTIKTLGCNKTFNMFF